MNMSKIVDKSGIIPTNQNLYLRSTGTKLPWKQAPSFISPILIIYSGGNGRMRIGGIPPINVIWGYFRRHPQVKVKRNIITRYPAIGQGRTQDKAKVIFVLIATVITHAGMVKWHLQNYFSHVLDRQINSGLTTLNPETVIGH